MTRTKQFVVSDLTYEEKVEATHKRIETAIKDYGYQCAVGCSFGKDSMVVLSIAQKFLPDILAVWCNTGVEGPVTEQFAKETTEQLGINLYEAEPKHGITFWTITKEHGWPGTRLKDKERVPRCCIDLKDKPAIAAYKMFGIRCIMTGITAEESRNRWLVMKRESNKAILAGIDRHDDAGRGGVRGI